MLSVVGVTILMIALGCAIRKYGARLVRWWSYMRVLRNIATPRRRMNPILGHLSVFPADFGLFVRALAALLLETIGASDAKLAVIWMSFSPMVSLFHPDAAEVVLRGSKHLAKPDAYRKSLPWLGDGVLLSEGEKWFQRRRLVTHSFHFSILESFLRVMNEQARAMVTRVERLRHNDGFDILHSIQLCTLDIICETAMGIRVNAQGDHNHSYVKALTRMAEITVLKTKNPLYQLDLVLKRSALGKEISALTAELQRFTANVIREKMRTFDASKYDDAAANGVDKKTAFLDVLMRARTEDGDKLSAGAIQEEVDTFMVAGHDTNAAAMGWTLYLLGRHPDVQRKVHAEIDRAFAGDGCFVTMDDVRNRFPYLEQVIKESLRLYPPVVIMGRRLTEQCTIDGHALPAGSDCYVNVYMMHRHPSVWHEPDRFDPDRFSKDNAAGRHPYAFIPFSAGPRNCLGQKFAMQEQKVLLSHFLRAFSVVSHTAEEDVRIVIGTAARAEHLDMTITKRRHG